VYIIVLNWNNYKDTKRCVLSLQRATYPNLRIIIVDNGSADESGKQLQIEFPQLLFVMNKSNLGFARGCNEGIREALKDLKCAFVLLLNNDSFVPPSFLELAVKRAAADGRIGLVGGKILHSPESKILAHAGGHISLWRGAMRVRGFGEIDRGQYDKACEVGFVTGAMMLIKRAVLEDVGLLPEEYFFGTEEQDYSLNVQRSGYKIYYVPEFISYHIGDGSHWNWDPKFVYNGYRNKLIFQQKYLPRGIFPIWKLVFTLYARFAALRSWKKMATRYGYDQGCASYEDMKFALIRAIEDHGKNTLSEQSLRRFEELLRNRKNVAADNAT
jgi:GT2 family glycosyltransferase